MAIFSDTTMNWLLPVMGFVAQPARAAKTASSSKDLKDFGMARDFTAGWAVWM
jgi:hypothetical protein